MPRKFYKFKLLLDENMPPRQRFPRLNSRFDLKHIRDDLNQTGLKDPPVYALAGKLNRLIFQQAALARPKGVQPVVSNHRLSAVFSFSRRLTLQRHFCELAFIALRFYRYV